MTDSPLNVGVISYNLRIALDNNHSKEIYKYQRFAFCAEHTCDRIRSEFPASFFPES